MNHQLLTELVKARQQALLADHSGHRQAPKAQPSWLTHIRNWLIQAKTHSAPNP